MVSVEGLQTFAARVNSVSSMYPIGLFPHVSKRRNAAATALGHRCAAGLALASALAFALLALALALVLLVAVTLGRRVVRGGLLVAAAAVFFLAAFAALLCRRLVLPAFPLAFSMPQPLRALTTGHGR